MKKILVFMSVVFLSLAPAFSGSLIDVIKKVKNKESDLLHGAWTLKDIEEKIEKCKVEEINKPDGNGNTALYHLVTMYGGGRVIQQDL